jgi:hypothetical protein
MIIWWAFKALYWYSSALKNATSIFRQAARLRFEPSSSRIKIYSYVNEDSPRSRNSNSVFPKFGSHTRETTCRIILNHWTNLSSQHLLCVFYFMHFLCSQHVSALIKGHLQVIQKKFHGLSPRANYTDRATAACRLSDCQLLLQQDTIQSVLSNRWKL